MCVISDADYDHSNSNGGECKGKDGDDDDHDDDGNDDDYDYDECAHLGGDFTKRADDAEEQHHWFYGDCFPY